MNPEIDIVVLASPVAKDKFMHAADVFEPFKVLVEKPTVLRAIPRDGETPASIIGKIKSAIDAQGTYRVVAIWQDGNEEGAWRDETVKVVSTGKQWSLIEPYLALFGFPQLAAVSTA